MDEQEEPKVTPWNTTVVLKSEPDRSAGSAPAAQEEINRTMPMTSVKTGGSPRTKPDRNLSARFSLEVFRKKGPNVTGKQEIIDEFFGKNLTKFVNLPIDNSSKPSLDSIPKLDNRYETLEVFNEGGQGIISAARENALGRIVALKTLRAEHHDPNSSMRDFIAEAKVTAQLDHPSIIPIYALGRNNDDHLQLAMKLVNGKTLREHLKNICLNYRRRGISHFDESASLFKRLELFLHVCDALVYAHHRRIMHCDLKP